MMPVKASLLESSTSSDTSQITFAGIIPVAGYLHFAGTSG
jgi:hypothetical protein